MWFFQDHKWKVKHDPNKKVPSRKSQAPVFRNKVRKLSSSEGSSENLRSAQAFEPTDAGFKPNG